MLPIIDVNIVIVHVFPYSVNIKGFIRRNVAWYECGKILAHFKFRNGVVLLSTNTLQQWLIYVTV